MKLPELKEKLKSKYIVRVVAGVLTIALVGTGIGATAVFAEKNSTAVTAEADSTTGSSKDADDIADKLMDSVSLKDNDADKDESVYLISDANGNVNKTIVVDHLKNKDKKDTLEDASNLSDIENVKGKEKFTQSGDKLTWQAGGKDIYYQGTATAEQDASAGLCEYLGLHHAFGVGGSFRNGVGLGKVDVPPGVMAQQVCQRHDAQLLEPLSGLGANALQVAHRRIRGEGGMVFGGHGVSAPFLDAI